MVKTLLTIKRIADTSFDFECSQLKIADVNKIAFENDLLEIPNLREIEEVLPILWKTLDSYDLSEDYISNAEWENFIDYLKIKK